MARMWSTRVRPWRGTLMSADDDLANLRELARRLEILLERSRWWRIGGFFLVVAAGVASFWAPSDVLREQGTPVFLVACSVLWLIGGVMCLVSAIRDRLVGEMLGIPLIGSALGIFAVALWAQGQASDGKTWLYAFIMAAFGAFLGDRWSECKALDRGWEMLEHLRGGNQ